jgi:hypothetical protein
MGETVRREVSMTTADGDWHTVMTLSSTPYLLARLVYPSRFLPLLLTSLHHVVISLVMVAYFITGVTLQLAQRLDYALQGPGFKSRRGKTLTL